jgi:putative ABC transport system permease protein
MSEQRKGGRRLHALPPREDVARELAFHVSMRAQDLIEEGWEPHLARLEAERLFGDYREIRRECVTVTERHTRNSRRQRMWGELMQDVRYALRGLARERGFAVIATLTLALGIGATTAAFGIVNGVLLRPLPYADPEQLVALWERNEPGFDNAFGWPNFRDVQQRARTLSGAAAYQMPFLVTVLGSAEPVRAPVARVTTNLFDVLGVQPARGRGFSAEESVVGGPPAVLVSDAFWRHQLGARTDLSQLTLEVNGVRAPVIGVMPPGFAFPGSRYGWESAPAAADLWFPLDITDPAGLGDRSAKNFAVVARLADGVTRSAAADELAVIARQIHQEHSNSDAVAVSVYDLREDGVGEAKRPLFILLGASAFVLLVACTNLASGLLARATRRQRELAVRVSLGARRIRLIRQLLTESVLLALVGAAAGVALAHLLLLAVRALGPASIPRLHEVRIDGWVLAFTTMLAVTTALTFGTAPALRATAVAPQTALQGAGRGTESLRQRRLWSLLVGGEVAMALLLLIGSGLLMRSFYALMQVDPGFDTTQQLAVEISLPETRYADTAARVRFYDELLEQVRALPNVTNAGLTITTPLVDFDPFGLFDIEGGEIGDGDAHYRVVSPGFFETMGTSVLQGRAFEGSDRMGAEDVILINRTMADKFFGGSAIGKRMRTGGMDDRGYDFARIVGIVEDVRYETLDAQPAPGYYLNYAQRPDRIGTMKLLVRTNGDPLLAGPAIRDVVRKLDGNVPVDMTSLEKLAGASFAERRFMLYVLAGFAAVALLLAAVGIYGVVAFAVAQRTREIGIRVALGALGSRVLWTVGRTTMLSVITGVACGLVLAVALSRLIASLLYEVKPADPVTFLGVAVLLIATAWVAVLVPARRALRISPMTALRAD